MTAQTSLFDANLSRVGSRIGAAVAYYIHCRLRGDGTFHAADLDGYVESVVGRTAPGSVGRILRQLRASGVVNYVVLSRSKSHYRAISTEAKSA